MASILLVDDDDQFRTMLSEVLTLCGHKVQQASDGQQASNLYGVHPTDLVITDLVMPGKEGLELILELKHSYSEAKIIAMSDGRRQGNREYLKMAKAFGAKQALAKPFSHQEILDAISQVLEVK